MSLQTRLASFISAVGADIKALQAKTPTILTGTGSLSDVTQPLNAVEWHYGSTGALVAKLIAGNPTVNSVILDRTDLRVRLKTRTGSASLDRLILDTDGNSDLLPMSAVTTLPTTSPGGGPLLNMQQCFFMPDPTNNPYVIWHLAYSTSDLKWYYLGGPPMTKRVTTDETFTSDSTYRDTATVGPSLTIPIAGDYNYQATANGYQSGQPLSFVLGLKIGAAAIAAPNVSQVQSSGSGAAQTMNIEQDLPGMTAGTVLKLQYLQAGPSTGLANARYRRLALFPVRIG